MSLNQRRNVSYLIDVDAVFLCHCALNCHDYTRIYRGNTGVTSSQYYSENTGANPPSCRGSRVWVAPDWRRPLHRGPVHANCADLGVRKARLTRRRGSAVRDNVTPDDMCCLSHVCLRSRAHPRTHSHMHAHAELDVFLFSRRMNWGFPLLSGPLVWSGKRTSLPMSMTRGGWDRVWFSAVPGWSVASTWFACCSTEPGPNVGMATVPMLVS